MISFRLQLMESGGLGTPGQSVPVNVAEGVELGLGTATLLLQQVEERPARGTEVSQKTAREKRGHSVTTRLTFNLWQARRPVVTVFARLAGLVQVSYTSLSLVNVV